MKRLLIGVALVALTGACAPRTALVCDREAQPWDKFQTQGDVCDVPRPVQSVGYSSDGVGGGIHTPTDPDDGGVTDGDGSGGSGGGSGGGEHDPDPDDDGGSRPAKGNNGHGNGDQDAPGNSLSHNNAENSEHSGKGNSGNGKGGNKW